eukprot:SAG31_NODE_26851_length_435_cov_1.062500_1_plen_96_part_10
MANIVLLHYPTNIQNNIESMRLLHHLIQRPPRIDQVDRWHMVSSDRRRDRSDLGHKLYRQWPHVQSIGRLRKPCIPRAAVQMRNGVQVGSIGSMVA